MPQCREKVQSAEFELDPVFSAVLQLVEFDPQSRIGQYFVRQIDSVEFFLVSGLVIARIILLCQLPVRLLNGLQPRLGIDPRTL